MSGDFNLEIKYEHVPRLESGSDASIEYLDEYGYVVIKNALTESEAAKTLDLLWDYLEELNTGIDRNDPSTWEDDRWPTCAHGGILPSYGIGHSESQWYLRGIPNVKKAFAKIWESDDLLTSFDGVSLWRPWNINPNWKTESGQSWFHIDQHPISKPGKQCVQGLVNLLPTYKEIGGNVVIPGSHKFFKDIPDEYHERLSKLPLEIDHFRFPNDDPKLSSDTAVMCHMEPGDMLLWDSRTVHCSSSGTSLDQETNTLIRAASLICMMPKHLTSEDVLEQRREAVDKLISTTNWTNSFRNADEFPLILEAEDRDKYTWPKKPILNEYQKSLID
jgi:ectoine hydroxylase-related dioxygenase (phytanoyl-CoA dioxygenase family)